MGENSAIEWTHHTFNPWRGCTKVSAGCANCYAEQLSRRNPATLGEWGDSGTRVIASESYWKQPLKWNRAAAAAGERHRVFCASLADVFEDRPELVAPRRRLFELIDQCRHLDWLLLTKRPENVTRLSDRGPSRSGMTLTDMPNVWLGVSVENQKQAEARIPHLLQIPAAVRFLSCEPLLGPVDLTRVDGAAIDPDARGITLNSLTGGCKSATPWHLNWIIVGGESGPNARPMHPDWARSLRNQCTRANVPFFFKQWGEWVPFLNNEWIPEGPANTPVCLVKPNGRSIRPYSVLDGPGHQMARVGKKRAGRLLDGREHNDFPTPEASNA